MIVKKRLMGELSEPLGSEDSGVEEDQEIVRSENLEVVKAAKEADKDDRKAARRAA